MTVETAEPLRRQLDRAESSDAVLAILERFAIPELTDDLRAASRKCRRSPFRLRTLSTDIARSSPHDRRERDRSLCVCLELHTLILKTVTTVSSRTHGHHFRDRVYASFKLLTRAQLAELIANPAPT